jgi:D-cysteine desulfhydrase family pyridoxal phosphate-dependent enzyme
MARLTAHRGGRGPRLLVKRDDLTGLALGGNKARKLELLVEDALAQGCDTLVTGGGPQSNHARLTAAAANLAGLDCHLALAGGPPEHADGNLLLDALLGATVRFTGAREYYEIEAGIEALASELHDMGRRPYAIPVGGASVSGVVAYARAVEELWPQLDELGVDHLDWIVVADGSGGTHAGLLAGIGASRGTQVLGVDVGTRPDLEEVVPRLATAAQRADGRPVGLGEVHVDHDHVGGGYGVLSDQAIGAMRLLARTESLVLDPVYTAKAMAALLDGPSDPDATVLFWHTGGAPALFARGYEERLTGG